MHKTLLAIELVWKQPLWVLDKYKYGLIIKVLRKEFKLLVSRKIPQKELEKRKQESLQWLSLHQRETALWFDTAYKTPPTKNEKPTDFNSWYFFNKK